MNAFEIRVKEEMNRVVKQETKYQEVLESLLFEEDIYELTVEDYVFGHNDIIEFCEKYARVRMAGSTEDSVLNLDSDFETRNEAIESICKKELECQIEMSKNEC